MDLAPQTRRDLRVLWAGQFVGDLGGQLTTFALPAIAIVLLHASVMQIALLQAFEFAVVPLVATGAGTLADRLPRKPLMLGANLVRLAALATIPAAWAMHALSLTQFFVVGAFCAAASVLFDTAYAALLPTLCGRDGVHRWIARSAMSGSAAEAIGASSAGAIVGTLGGPIAVACNVATYLAVTLNLARVRIEEPVREPHGDRAVTFAELSAGFRFVSAEPILRATAACTATAYLGGAMVAAVFTIYCYRTLALSPAQLGLTLGLANLGLIGGAAAQRISSRFGPRRTLVTATLLSALGKFAFLLHAAPFAAVLAGRMLLSLSGPIASTTQQALQTARTPDALLGRTAAAMRTIAWGALPIGSLLGGAIATRLDAGAAIAAGGSISLVAVAWLAMCPAMSRRRLGAALSA